MISESLETIPVQNLVEPVGWKDLGAEFLGDWEGACIRSTWYRKNGTQETNPPKSRVALSHKLDSDVKRIIMERIGARFVRENVAPWKVGPFTLQFDTVVDLCNMTRDQVGVLIIPGGGISFRNEVFGTKYKQGSARARDWVRAAMMLSSCPLELAEAEIIYVDRGMMDHVGYTIKRGEGPGKPSLEKLLDLLSGPIPKPSYEKNWVDIERVARLYADRKISKADYEEYKKTGIGGDWNCRYCGFLDRCRTE